MKKIFLIFCIFIEQIMALELDFDTFSSDFTQIIKTKNSSFSYSGHFILSKDEAYWSYTSPNKKEIYINKNQIIIIEHDLKQSIISKLQNIPKLSEIFKKAKMINQNEFVAKYENVSYNIKIHQDQVKSIAYKDEFDNEVLIHLNNSIKNPKIDTRVFKAQIPQDYDVIK